MSNNVTAYYNATADRYDDLHLHEDDAHTRALELNWPAIQSLQPRSLLDVGCGTGRTLRWVNERFPTVQLFGIDPSVNLLHRARLAVPSATVSAGDGACLEFPDNSIEVVAASAIMHHVDEPRRVIAEMFRVAKKAVLISDHNNFSFGGYTAQRARMILYCLGLLNVATFVKQGFKRQGYTDTDGWWYPYSLSNNFAQISELSRSMQITPTHSLTHGIGGNFLFSMPCFAVLAFK